MGLAFGAGLVAVLNPCGFAMLPVYMTLVVRGDATGQLTALRRAGVATIEMVLGFMTVFGAFGLLTVSAAATVQLRHGGDRFSARRTRHLVAGRPSPPPGFNPVTRSSRWAPTAHGGSMFGYGGVGYAIASLSCTIGPFLAVTAASFRSGLIVNGLLTYLVYAAGMSLIVGVLAIAAAFANPPSGVYRMRRILPYINRFGGALVLLVGLYVGYYGGAYEIRIFNGTAAPDDPVITGAGRIQGAVVTWVHGHGGYPWLAALSILMLGAFAVAWTRRLRRTAKVRRVLRLHAGELSPSSF